MSDPTDGPRLSPGMLWIEMHPRSDVLALAEGAAVVLWKGEVLHTAAHEARVVQARWSPDGSRLAVCETRGRVTIYDEELYRLAAFDAGHGTLYASAFNDDGTLFATGGVEGGAIVWQVGDSFSEKYRVRARNVPEVRSLAFSGATLLLGFSDGYFDALTNDGKDSPAGGELFPGASISAMAKHPTEPVVVMGGSKGSITAMNTQTWRVDKVWRNVPPKPIAVNQLAFSRDGRYLLAACSDDCARMFEWDRHDPYGRELGRPFHSRRPKPNWNQAMIVSSACFSGDGTRVFTGHFDDRLLSWDLRDSISSHVTLRP
jgi:WD40 repeat protein